MVVSQRSDHFLSSLSMYVCSHAHIYKCDSALVIFFMNVQYMCKYLCEWD